MSEKTMFESAVDKVQSALRLLEDAKKQFATLGIDVNNFTICGVDLFGSPHHVLLSSGINRASVLAEKEIKSLYSDSSFGSVMLDGFYFDQQKLPVERQDRYA